MQLAFLSHFLFLTLTVMDIVQAREFISKLGELNQTQIFAKIENVEVNHLKVVK